MEAKESFGEMLKRLIKEHGMSQSKLAERTGIDRSTINRLVNSKRDPRSEEVEWIAKALNVESEELRKDVEFLSESPQPSERDAELAARVLQAETMRAEAVARAEALEKEIRELQQSIAAREGQLHAEFEREKAVYTKDYEQKKAALMGKYEKRMRDQSDDYEDRIHDVERELGRQRTQFKKVLDEANTTIWKLQTKVRTLTATTESLQKRNATLEEEVGKAGGKMLISALVGGLFGSAISSGGGGYDDEDDDY